MKCEEAQRANRLDGDDDASPPSNDATSKQGMKRKSYNVSASLPQTDSSQACPGDAQ